MTLPSITRLLLVEDNRRDAAFLEDLLTPHPQIEIMLVESMREAETRLATGAIDVVVLDLTLPDARGTESVRRSHVIAPNVAIVVLTGAHHEALAAELLQEGAQEYLVKGQIDRGGFLRALTYAVERKAMQIQGDIMAEALYQERERARVTLACIGDAVACTNLSGVVTYINASAERMTGWSSQEALGRRLSDVFSLVDASPAALKVTPRDTGIGEETIDDSLDYRLRRRDGLEVSVEHSVAAIHDRHGRIVGTVLVFRDVSVARSIALKTAHSAQHDALTQLPNRTRLRDHLKQAIALALRHSTEIAVLFIDLDGFKQINDSLGHGIGDQLLQSVATRLLECVRESDTVSRHGGDEFIVLLRQVHLLESVGMTATRILQAVASPHAIEGHALRVTASIGISTFPRDGVDLEMLIKNADIAMYQAKAGGRHSYQFFDQPGTPAH